MVTHRLSLMVLHAGALGTSSTEPAVRAAVDEFVWPPVIRCAVSPGCKPAEPGLPFTTWSLTKLVNYLAEHAWIRASTETVSVHVRIRQMGDGRIRMSHRVIGVST